MITDFRLLDTALRAAVDTQMGRRDYGKDMLLLVQDKKGGFGQPTIYTLSRAECAQPWLIEFEYTHHYDGPPYSSFVSIKEIGETLVQDLTRLADERDAILNAIVTATFQSNLSYEDDPDGSYHRISFTVTATHHDIDQFFNDHLEEIEDSEGEFGTLDSGGGEDGNGGYAFGCDSSEITRERTDEFIQRWHNYFAKLGWMPGPIAKTFVP